MKKLTKNGRLINIADTVDLTVKEPNFSIDNSGYTYFPDTGEFLIYSKVNAQRLLIASYADFQQSDGTISADVAAAKTYLNSLFTND